MPPSGHLLEGIYFKWYLSFLQEEPQAGSSSGRFRHTRKNIIPAEGEDESSFDEDSEDDSDSGDEDEPRPWASGSDDSSEEDEGMPESEEDEDEEDGCGEMGSGEVIQIFVYHITPSKY